MESQDLDKAEAKLITSRGRSSHEENMMFELLSNIYFFVPEIQKKNELR